MKIVTLGGATRDIFIHQQQEQTLAWSSKEEIRSFLLLQEGTKIEISSIEYAIGGGALNSATSFKRLGFEVTALFKVGNDEQGNAILAQMTQEGITLHPFARSSEPTGISYIIPAADGDNCVLAFRGANAHISQDEFPFKILDQTQCLYITSLSGKSAQLLLPVTRYAHDRGILVANNPGISQLSAGIDVLKNSLAYIDIFILNSSEAQRFMISLSQVTPQENHFSLKTNIAHTDLPPLLQSPLQCNNMCFNLIQYFKTVEDHGPRIVVVTDGAHGVYVYSNDTIYYHPSLPVKVVNTLGAGDAFGSCFVASVAQKQSIEQAMLNGLLNSTSVITHLGAQTGLLTKEQLAAKAKKVDLSLLKKFTL